MNAIKSKRSNISPFLAIDMLTRANKLKSKGKDIIHMDVGEPGFNTPRHILKYAKTIIEEKKVFLAKGLVCSLSSNQEQYKKYPPPDTAKNK